MAITTDVTYTTLQYIIKEASEGLKRRHAFLDYAEKAKGIQIIDGGARIDQNVVVQDHSSVTFHTTGMEATTDAFNTITQNASFDWGFWSTLVAINEKEKAVNQGSLAVLDILEERTKNAMDKIGRDLNSQILANTSVVGTCGVQTLYGNDAAGVGFLEGVAKASQNNSVGGLSKATYNVPGWTNAWASASGAFSTNGLSAMHSIFSQINSVHRGPKPVDVIIASEASFRLYKSALQANERYVDVKALDGGRMDLVYNGAPVAADLALTQSSWSGDDIFSMYFINFAGVDLRFLKGYDFVMKDIGHADGSIIDRFRLMVGVQLIAKHLGSMGVLTNANS